MSCWPLGFIIFLDSTLLTWLLFSWLIPLLFLSYSSYVAPRPHLIRSLLSVLPFPLVLFPPLHYLASTEGTQAQCGFWLPSPYIQTANMFALTKSVHTVNLWLPAWVVIQITGQRVSELCCSSKNPISAALFCLQDRRRGERNITSSTVGADNTLKTFKGNEGSVNGAETCWWEVQMFPFPTWISFFLFF